MKTVDQLKDMQNYGYSFSELWTLDEIVSMLINKVNEVIEGYDNFVQVPHIKGNFNKNEDYKKFDLLNYNGETYICKHNCYAPSDILDTYYFEKLSYDMDILKEAISHYDSIEEWDKYFTETSGKIEEKYTVRLNELNSDLNDISKDDTFKNNHFKSHQISYIGVQNEGYPADNASRLYILPKDHVSTGVGGAIKVFGDDFSKDDLNYRDLGIYFCADQLGQLGYHDVGAFYINSKVNGQYNLKNPDIIFSFQDGTDIGGRFVRVINDSHTDSRAIFVVGESEPIATLKDETAVMEIQGNAVFQNGKALKWLNGAGTSVDSAIYYTKDNRLRLQGLGSIEMIANNALKMIFVDKYTRFDNALICNTQVEYKGTETNISAEGTNLIKFAQSSQTNINSITGGQNGQELVLYFSNNYTTIKQNNVSGGIALANGSDFVGTSSDMLTLLYVSDRWVEKCRSIN